MEYLTVWAVRDEDGGDIEIRQDEEGFFTIRYQVDGGGAMFWETDDRTFNTLKAAVAACLVILQANVDNFYYDDRDGV